MVGDIERLRTLDKLIMCRNETVKDLIEQAIVASEIVNESEERYLDIGPLELMYTEIKAMRVQIESLTKNSHGIGESNPYQNVTWTDNTTGWTGSQWADPTRNYPSGYVWNPLLGKVTSINGTK
jgi:hypothetical protein